MTMMYHGSFRIFLTKSKIVSRIFAMSILMFDIFFLATHFSKCFIAFWGGIASANVRVIQGEISPRFEKD